LLRLLKIYCDSGSELCLIFAILYTPLSFLPFSLCPGGFIPPVLPHSIRFLATLFIVSLKNTRAALQLLFWTFFLRCFLTLRSQSFPFSELSPLLLIIAGSGPHLLETTLFFFSLCPVSPEFYATLFPVMPLSVFFLLVFFDSICRFLTFPLSASFSQIFFRTLF